MTTRGFDDVPDEAAALNRQGSKRMVNITGTAERWFT
jgi:hypothetical protein